MQSSPTWKPIVSLTPGQPWQAEWDVVRGKLAATARGLEAAEVTVLRRHFERPGFGAFRAVFDLTSPSGEGIDMVAGDYGYATGSMARPEARLTLNATTVAVTGRGGLRGGQPHRIVFERARGRLRLTVDGRQVLDAPDPSPDRTASDLRWTFPQGAVIRDARLELQQPAAPAADKLSDGYDAHICIDFFDDLILNPWTQRTVEQAMDIYRQRGIGRVYFVYHYGIDGGFWDHSPRPGHTENIRRTADAIGDFLPAITRAAHAAGLEMIAVLKPYETAFPYTYPHGSSLAARHGKVPRIDGRMWWCPNVVVEHPDWRPQRSLADVPDDIDSRVIGKIVLTAEAQTGSGFDPSRLRLWVSADNGGYRPYDGPLRVQRSADDPTQIVLDHLTIPQRFIALSVEGSATHTYGNTFRHLLSLYDNQGNPLPSTLATLTYPRKLPVQQAGFVFDYPISSGSALLDDYFWLDGTAPIAAAKGRERYLAGGLCEAYDGVQDWWMQQVERCLTAGVDGIDFRIVNHARAFDWHAFSYNPPLVEAYARRYGHNILHQPPDPEKMRRLRGELYTGFLRRARQRLSQAGKAMHLHVSSRMQHPAWHTEMEIHFDWPAWIRQGLADEITLKLGSARGDMASRVVDMAHEQGMKVNFCPYLNGLPASPWGKQVLDAHVRDARRGHVDGFILYENAALIAAEPDESLRVTCPWLLDTVIENARPRSTQQYNIAAASK